MPVFIQAVHGKLHYLVAIQLLCKYKTNSQALAMATNVSIGLLQLPCLHPVMETVLLI